MILQWSYIRKRNIITWSLIRLISSMIPDAIRHWKSKGVMTRRLSEMSRGLLNSFSKNESTDVSSTRRVSTAEFATRSIRVNFEVMSDVVDPVNSWGHWYSITMTWESLSHHRVRYYSFEWFCFSDSVHVTRKGDEDIWICHFISRYLLTRGRFAWCIAGSVVSLTAESCRKCLCDGNLRES